VRQYASYAATDSQWLDSIPAHWKMGRLDHVARAWPSNVDKHSVEGELPVRLCNYTDVYKNDAIVGELPFMAATAPAEQVERFRIRIGDTLITKDSETANDIGVPAYVAYEAGDLVCGYHLSIIRPDPAEIDPKYLFWALRSQPTLGQWEVLASGVTRVGIRSGDVSKAALVLPPLDEQRAIADYLDRETARIDTLIEEQGRLVEMLRERRRSMRTEVALRGTQANDTVASPLSWAERIPANWQVVPLTAVARLESGHTPSRTREDWWQDCYIPWISLNDVGAMRETKYIEVTTHELSDEGIANSSARLLPAGTVVLSRDATVGRTSIMRVPMATSQHFAAWICGPLLEPEYLWNLFTDAMQPHFDSFQNGSTIRTIGMGDLKAFRIPVPPLDEQRRIAAYLDEQTAKIDALITETETFIELSRERRSALITAAVTGQIDVRDAA